MKSSTAMISSVQKLWSRPTVLDATSASPRIEYAAIGAARARFRCPVGSPVGRAHVTRQRTSVRSTRSPSVDVSFLPASRERAR